MLPEREPLEAGLGNVTDDEWLQAHADLTEKYGHVFPKGELDFVWDPDLDPATLLDGNDG